MMSQLDGRKVIFIKTSAQRAWKRHRDPEGGKHCTQAYVRAPGRAWTHLATSAHLHRLDQSVLPTEIFGNTRYMVLVRKLILKQSRGILTVRPLNEKDFLAPHRV